eukprot:Sdes_comp16182_c0_seq1m5431
MQFCGASSFDEFFHDGVVSQCYFETVLSSMSACFVVLHFLYQLCPVPSRKVQSHTFLFNFIYSCCITTICVHLSHLVGRLLLSNHDTLDDSFSGYILLSNILYSITSVLAVISLRNSAHKNSEPSVWITTYVLVTCVALSYKALFWLKPHWWHDDRNPTIRWFDFAIDCCRLLFSWALLISYLWLRHKQANFPYQSLPTQEQNHEEAGAKTSKKSPQSVSETKKWFRQFFQFAPHVWPKTAAMNLRIFSCFLLIIAGRLVNLSTPIIFKKLVDELTPSSERGPIFDPHTVGVFMLLKWLQGGSSSGSVLSAIQSFVWIPVDQYTSSKCRIHVFEHVQGLSLHWHLNKKTGEVTRILDRGTSSVSAVINALLIFLLPIFLDMFVGVSYLAFHFDIYIGVVVVFSLFLYVSVTAHVTEWRIPFRKSMNAKDNEINKKAVDSLMGFETVKYFGAEDYEVARYEKSIRDYLVEEWKSLFSLSVLNISQSTVLSFGSSISAFMCAYKVAYGKYSVGDFVLFLQYMNQLSLPLNWFGTYYRSVQQNLIDMDNMFALLDVEPDVKDSPGAQDFVPRSHPPAKQSQTSSQPAIVFEDVFFRYPGFDPRMILHGISFSVPEGTSCALVGPTGSGKSTVVRLLFRFYDLHSGQIFLDGQNLGSLKQKSLRKALGIVPQETMLFHDTIKFNIHYGNLSCPEEAVWEAAKAAEIHDQVLRFEHGYETVVGERGLRLSGGEKQRVAMARMMLKDPYVIILDEATSALDTKTERSIQASLERLCAKRTTLIVAHRLSTIVNCDQILVLNQGVIVERGTHSSLLAQNGVYAEMWRCQLQEEKYSDS